MGSRALRGRDSRGAAGGRRAAGVVCGLYAGEESRSATAPIRPWRHQGRGGAGSRLPLDFWRDPGLEPVAGDYRNDLSHVPQAPDG
jgi:hypothetical protein